MTGCENCFAWDIKYSNLAIELQQAQTDLAFSRKMNRTMGIEALLKEHNELVEVLEELVDVLEYAREEGYDNIDYFTTQPARQAIRKARA